MIDPIELKDISPIKYAQGEDKLFAIVHQYHDGNTCIDLVDEEGIPFCKATVNVPEAELGENEVLLKGWSENAGVPKAMVRNSVTRDTGRRVKTGFVEAEVHEILLPLGNE